MSTSAWTDYQVTRFFSMFPTSPYLSLHYANPVLGGLGQAEFSGGSYVRQSVVMATVSGRAIHNTNPILFTGLPAATAAYIGVWSLSAAGNLCAYVEILPTVTISAGGQFPINVGDLAFTF